MSKYHKYFLKILVGSLIWISPAFAEGLFNLQDLTAPGIELGGVPLPNQYQCLTGSIINAADDLGISPSSKKYKSDEDDDDEDSEFDYASYLEDLQGTTFSDKCPAPGKIIDNISCSRLCSDPKDCKEKVDRIIKNNKKAETAQACVANESKKFKLEVGCAKGLLDSIKQTAQFLMQQVREGLSQIRELYQQSERVKEDLKAKAGEAAAKEQQLDQEIQKAEQELAEMEGQIQNLKTLQRRDADQEQMFKEMRDQKIPAAQAMACVYETPYKSCQNEGRADTGETKSVSNYTACAVQNKGSLQKDGSEGSRDKGKRNEAAALRQKLDTILAQIRADTPKQTVVPSTVEELAALQKEPTRILSYQDLERKYGAALREITAPGFNAGEFLLSEFRRCFNTAIADRKREQGIRSTQFGELSTKIKNDRESTQRLANNLVTGLAQNFRKADDKLNDGRVFNVDGISPQRTIVPIAGCVDTKPDIALGCLENLRQLRRAQLTGEDFPPKVGGEVLSIGQSIAGVRGTNKNNPVARPCQGLNACRDRYRFIKEETAQAAAQIETELQPKYRADAERILKNAQQQLGFRFDGLAKALNDQLEQMKAKGAGLGFSGSVDAKVKSEGVKLGKDGLPEDPDDILAFINGGPIANKVPELGNDAFDDVYENIAERVKELEAEGREVADANEEIAEDALACVADAEKERFDELGREVSQLGSFNCGWVTDLCTRKEENLSDIAAIIGRLREVDGKSVGSLTRTVRGVCADSGNNVEELASKKDLKSTKSEALAKAEETIRVAGRAVKQAEDRIDDARRRLDRIPAGESTSAAESELSRARSERDTAQGNLTEAESVRDKAKREIDELDKKIDDLEDEQKKAERADCRGIASGVADKAKELKRLQETKRKFGESEADTGK